VPVHVVVITPIVPLTIVVTLSTHHVAEVPVTVYAPAPVTTILGVFAPLLQLYPDPPFAVNVTSPSLQLSNSFPLTVIANHVQSIKSTSPVHCAVTAQLSGLLTWKVTSYKPGLI